MLFALSFLINRGQNTEFILEIFAEILGVVKAQLIRYLRYILLTLAQHLRRSFQTDDTDKFNGCLTGYLQEFLVKMYPAHTQSPAQLFYGQVTPTDVLDYILNLLVIRKETQTTENLGELRNQIDDCDNEIIEVLAKRMRVCREIGTFKKEHDMTILQTGRYNEILDKRGAQGSLCGMDSDFIKKVFEAIHEESVRQQMEIINK